MTSDTASGRFNIRHVDRGGRTTAWTSLGDGQPVLWLTPYFIPLRAQEVLRTTRALIDAIARTHRLVLVDDRYYQHGRSEAEEPIPEGYLDELVLDVLAILDAASVDRCHVVASYYATLLAVALAGRHPDRVESLLLWNGLLARSLPMDPAAKELTDLILSPNIEVATRSYLAAMGIDGDSEIAEEQRELITALRDQPVPDRVAIRALKASDVTADAPHVACRALVILPERAVMPGQALTEELGARLPTARLMRVRSAAVGLDMEQHEVAHRFVLTWLTEGEAEPPVEDAGVGAPVAELTPREFEVCQQIALGRTNLEIAEALSISRWTVQRHVSNAIRKTGASNRAGLAALVAERRGG